MLLIQSGGRRRKQTDAPEWTPEEEAFFDRFLRICEARGIGPWRLAQLLETSPGTVHPWFAPRVKAGGGKQVELGL